MTVAPQLWTNILTPGQFLLNSRKATNQSYALL